MVLLSNRESIPFIAAVRAVLTFLNTHYYSSHTQLQNVIITRSATTTMITYDSIPNIINDLLVGQPIQLSIDTYAVIKTITDTQLTLDSVELLNPANLVVSGINLPTGLDPAITAFITTSAQDASRGNIGSESVQGASVSYTSSTSSLGVNVSLANQIKQAAGGGHMPLNFDKEEYYDKNL